MTTRPGSKNRTSQIVMCETMEPGSDHGQFIYALRCRHCGLQYGANGSTMFERKCPGCQGVLPGLHIPTFLLTWKQWEWPDVSIASALTLAGGSYLRDWQVQSHKKIGPSHRVFAFKQGWKKGAPINEYGLAASGYVKSEPRPGTKWDAPDQSVFKVDINFDTILDPLQDGYLPATILKDHFPRAPWNHQKPDISISDRCILSKL